MEEIIDQVLHFSWTFIAILPIFWKQNKWTAGLSALFICLPRELVDQWHGWPIGFWKLVDITFFFIGGIAVDLFFQYKKEKPQ